MGALDDWTEVVNAIDADWLLVDLPGHGATPLGPPPSLDRWARQLSRLIASAFSGPAFVVGYSMGGRLALRLAHVTPASVIRLALVSASPGLEDEDERAARRAQDRRRSEAILSDFGAFRDSWYSAPLFALDSTQAARAAQRRADVDVASAAALVRALSPGKEPSSWPVLDSLTGPVLVAAGANDAKYVELTARMTASLGARAEHRLIPGAGHSVHLDAPGELGRVVNEWLRR